jgi:hypothetical protein
LWSLFSTAKKDIEYILLFSVEKTAKIILFLAAKNPPKITKYYFIIFGGFLLTAKTNNFLKKISANHC